jgi:hypothetical protein
VYLDAETCTMHADVLFPGVHMVTLGGTRMVGRDVYVYAFIHVMYISLASSRSCLMTHCFPS